jgi:hypothetical protein
MHFIKYCTVILFAVFLCASCYKDKGNYTYRKLPDFYVDTAGKQNSFTIFQFSELSIAPSVVFEGDSKKLRYMWRLTGGGATDTLPPAKDLRLEMKRVPGNYSLEFRAIDTTTGIMALMSYPVTVQSTYPYGWMILHERGGQTDVDFLRTKELSGNLLRDTVYREVFFAKNGRRLPGTPISIYQPGTNGLGTQKNDRINLFTSNGGARLTNADFGVIQDYGQMFNEAPPVIKPEGVYSAWGNEIIVNDKGIHYATNGITNFSIRVQEPKKNYEAAPWITRPNGANIATFYDQLNMRFLILPQFTNEAVTYSSPSSPLSLFDLNNIGKKMLFIDHGFGTANSEPQRYAIFRDPAGAGRFLYVINFQAATTNPSIAKIDISAATGITAATQFGVSNLGPFVLYTSGRNIYRITFDIAGNSMISNDVAFDKIPASEEITCMKICKVTGSNQPSGVNMNSRLVFVATWNATAGTGKIYQLNINEVSGIIDQVNYKVFDGFGKIGDMNPKVL